MAKDGTIGPNGRSVCCARCENVWYVEGVDPETLALKDNEAVLLSAELEPAPEPELPSVPKIKPPATIGAHTLLRNKADAEKLSKRKRAIRLIWAGPLLILGAVAAFTFFKRQAIVETFPRTATLYQALGLDLKANGLDVRDLKSQRLVVDGEPVLRVTGQVVNLTSKTISSPLVQLRWLNRSGEPLADWFVEPGTISGGGSVDIETDYPAPPIDGVEIAYRFVTDDQ